MSKQNIVKSSLFVIAIVGIGACVLWPLIFRDTFNDFASSISSLITAMCSILTLIIAVLLYDKYGIERTVRDKNFDAVTDLMETLLKLRLTIHSKNHSNEWFLCNINFQRNYNNDINHLTPEDLSLQLFFSMDSVDKLSEMYEKIIWNLFMPKEIVEKAKTIFFGAFDKPDDSIQIPHCVVGVGYKSINDVEIFSTTPPITLMVFIEYLDELKQSCVSWLNENGGGGSINDTPY